MAAAAADLAARTWHELGYVYRGASFTAWHDIVRCERTIHGDHELHRRIERGIKPGNTTRPGRHAKFFALAQSFHVTDEVLTGDIPMSSNRREGLRRAKITYTDFESNIKVF